MKLFGSENDRTRPHGTLFYALIYSGALALIALLALASHLLVDKIIAEEATTGTVVKIAARQVALSQRIGGLSFQYAQSAPQERQLLEPLLRQSIGLMRSSHEALIRGDRQLGLPDSLPSEVDEIYFGENGGLDQRVRRFLVLAEDFLRLPEDLVDPRNQGLVRLMGAAQDTLMEELSQAVMTYEEVSKRNIEELRLRTYGLIAAILSVLFLEAVFVFRPLFRNLVQQRESLFDMARRDPLTGCLNRRSVLEGAALEFARSKRYGNPLTVAMLDIDYFKHVNDKHGHAGGDAVLNRLVEMAQETVRKTDIFGRVGGEEFAFILPETDLEGAYVLAEKLRMLSEAAEVRWAHETITFTVSIGLGVVSQLDQSEQQALSRADKALYQAKQAGRNRVAAFNMDQIEAVV